ncbi:hypothetical protein [Streptomyces werraensis]|uniref:hypothetical protein n=1 Tax=Streptomyces werraensis TaxID=68284 RepID=UPI0033B2F1EC
MGRTGAQPAPAPAAAAPGYRAVLRAPGMRAVFAAHAVSTAGKLAAEVALSILVHQRTGSPLLSSLVLVCAFAPHAVGGTALSALADRFPPRRSCPAATCSPPPASPPCSCPACPWPRCCSCCWAPASSHPSRRGPAPRA